MLKTLLYISHSQLPRDNEEAQVADILEISRARNEATGVTGALIFTGAHFAQFIEGPPRSVEDIMSRVMNDNRHHTIDTIFDRQAADRRFHDWSMAYSGPSNFVRRRIAPLLMTAGDTPPRVRAKAAEAIVALMAEFTR